MRNLLILLTAGVFALSACGGDKKAGDSPEMEETTTEEMEDKAAEVQEVVIEGDDQMKFNKDKITVKAGSKVKLTLKHVGKLPVEQMGHNWILLKKGVDLPTFATAGVEAGIENEHIDPKMEGDIIAHTDLIGGGEETTITFEAPEPGTYEFLCSFPGHWAMMRGEFIVE